METRLDSTSMQTAPKSDDIFAWLSGETYYRGWKCIARTADHCLLRNDKSSSGLTTDYYTPIEDFYKNSLRQIDRHEAELCQSR